MGDKLVEIYDKAFKIGGQKAKMRMAMMTATPSVAAQNVPDTPEAIAKFEVALREIEKEFI
jgi:hypothetical protein